MSNERTENNISPHATALNLTDQEFTYVILGSIGVVATGLGTLAYRENQRTTLPLRESVDLLRSHPNDAAIQDLINRGYASVDEILEASFGEWPPNGLDIVSDNRQEIYFENIENERRLAEGKYEGTRIIRTNGAVVQQEGLTHVVSHENTHIVQGDNTFREDEIYNTRFTENSIQQDVQMHHGSNDPARKIFEKHADSRLTNQVNQKSLERLDYLSSGTEVQARITEALVEGYQGWGRMPSNPEEFYAAMHNVGFEIPDKVMQKFEKSSTWSQTKAIFDKEEVPKLRAVNEIGEVTDYLTKAGKVEFWNNAMPQLYADLIEMMGDSQGRARFSLGQNIRPEIRMEREIQDYVLERRVLDEDLSDSNSIIPDFEATSNKYEEEARSILESRGRLGLREETDKIRDIRFYTRGKISEENRKNEINPHQKANPERYKYYAKEANDIFEQEGSAELRKQSSYYRTLSSYESAAVDLQASRIDHELGEDIEDRLDYKKIQADFNDLYSKGGLEAIKRETFSLQFRYKAQSDYINDMQHLRERVTNTRYTDEQLNYDYQRFDGIMDESGFRGVEDEVRRLYVSYDSLQIYIDAREAVERLEFNALNKDAESFVFNREALVEEFLSLKEPLNDFVATDTQRFLSQLNNLDSSIANDIQTRFEENIKQVRELEAANALEVEGTVQDLSKASKGARAAGTIPVVGAAVGLGSAVLTNQAHAGQQDYATELHAQGILDTEALNAYNQINNKYDKLFMGDAVGGGAAEFLPVAGQAAGVIVSISIEVGAKREFENWADKYAPNLTEEQYQTLSMSFFTADSARTEMILNAAGKLPNVTDDEAFTSVVNARNSYFEARNEMINEHGRLGGHRKTPEQEQQLKTLSETHDLARENLIGEMENLMADPANIDKFLNYIPVDDRLEYVRRLAQSDTDPKSMAENHPEVNSYLIAYDDANILQTKLFGFDEEWVLSGSPALINAYIKDRSGISSTSDNNLKNSPSKFTIRVAEFNGKAVGDPLTDDNSQTLEMGMSKVENIIDFTNGG